MNPENIPAMPAFRPHLMLLVTVLLGFGSVFLLPEAPPIRESRLARHLPEQVGDWTGTPVVVSGRELDVLAKDTEFERKSYRDTWREDVPGVEVSVVFSGKDMSNSIHRPEVCLRTQGWNFVRERTVMLKDVLAEGGDLPVREIVCSRLRRDPESGQHVVLPNGKMLEDRQLFYYTFIGSRSITSGHYSRTFADIRDRLVGGYDQRWAYVTFATVVTGSYADQGLNLGGTRAMNVDESGQFLADFMAELLPRVVAAPEA